MCHFSFPCIQVFCSPLRRALLTAFAAYPDNKIVVDPRLREVNASQGLTLGKLQAWVKDPQSSRQAIRSRQEAIGMYICTRRPAVCAQGVAASDRLGAARGLQRAAGGRHCVCLFWFCVWQCSSYTQ